MDSCLFLLQLLQNRNGEKKKILRILKMKCNLTSKSGKFYNNDSNILHAQGDDLF